MLFCLIQAWNGYGHFSCVVAVCILWLFLTMPWVGQSSIIVPFPGHKRFFFWIFALLKTRTTILVFAFFSYNWLTAYVRT